MTNAEATAKYQAGDITIMELAAVMEANAKADQQAANLAMHGTANSVQVFTDIRADR